MISRKKKGLGRGLSALFGDQSVEEKANVKLELNKVSISDLSRNPYQPRQMFDKVKLEQLTESIKLLLRLLSMVIKWCVRMLTGKQSCA